MVDKARKIKYKIIASAALLVLVVVYFLLNILAQRFFERELSEYLSRSTKGEYTISYDDLDVSIFTQSLRIAGISIEGKPTVAEDYYKLNVSELVVGNFAVYRLFNERRLHVDLLQISNPELFIYTSQSATEEPEAEPEMVDPDQLLEKMKPFLSSTLFEIAVDRCEVNSVNVEHYLAAEPDKLVNSIKRLDVAVDAFLIDTTVIANGEFFQSDEVSISMKDFEYMLSDDNHHLHVGNLTYLLHNQSIVGEKMSVLPTDTTVQEAPLYWIELPYLKIKAQVNAITNPDSIIIDSLAVKHANIRYKPASAAASNKQFDLSDLNKIDLYSLIKKDLLKVGIKNLLLEADQIKIEAADSTKQAQLLNGLHFRAINLELDSASQVNPNKLLYTDDFELKLSAYKHVLNDKTHELSAEDVCLSSFDQRLSGNKIELRQLNSPSDPNQLSFRCDSVVLDGIDLPMLHQEQRMPVHLLGVYQPDIRIKHLFAEPDSVKANSKAQSIEDFVFKLVHNYVDGIYADMILFENGEFRLIDHTAARDKKIGSRFDVKLEQFELDDQTIHDTQRLFFAHQFEIDLHDYRMDMNDQIHSLEIEKVYISSRDEQVNILSAHFHKRPTPNMRQLMISQRKRDIFDICIPSLKLDRINLIDAFFHQQVAISSLLMDKPEIKVEHFAKGDAQLKQVGNKINVVDIYALLHSYLEQLYIGDVLVSDAHLNYTVHSRRGKTSDLENMASVHMHAFMLNNEMVEAKESFPAEYFELQLKDHKVQLGDEVHALTIEEINFSSLDSTLSCTNARIIADQQSPKYNKVPWHLNGTIDGVKVNNIDIDEIGFDHIFDVGDFAIAKPNISMHQNFKRELTKQSAQGNFNFNILMPKGIDGIKINRLNISEGRFRIFQRVEGEYELAIKANVDLQIDKPQVIRQGDLNYADLSFDRFNLDIQNLYLNSLHNNQYFTSKQLYISSISQQLILYDFAYINEDEEGLLYKFLSFPKLTLNALDINEAVDNRRFNASSIRLDKPIIDLKTRRLKNGNVLNPFKLKLDEGVQKFLDEISTDTLLVEDALVFLPENAVLDSLTGLDLALNNVLIDTLYSDNLLAAETFNVSTANTTVQDARGLYTFSLDSIYLSSKNKELSLKGIGVSPNYQPNAYQQFFNYQSDYFKANLAELRFEGINLSELILSKSLFSEKLYVDSLNFFSYRDKALPPDLENRPPMLQDAIKGLRMPLAVDTVIVDDATFTYSEQIPSMPGAYEVMFSHTDLAIYPVTNISSRLAVQPKLFVDGSAILLESANIKLNMEYDMLDKAKTYRVKGELAPFELTTASDITNNAALVSIKSGQLNEMHFDFTADTASSRGDFYMDYEQLKIMVLKYKNEEIKERKFISFLANTFFVPSKSKKDEEDRNAAINWKRDESKSVFNYWWKSIASGLADSFDYETKKKK